MSIRSYPCGGRRHEIEYFEGVLAVCVEDNTPQGRSTVENLLGTDQMRQGSSYCDQTNQTCLHAFESSGWMFLEPNTHCQNSIDKGKTPSNTYAYGRMCKRSNGDILISMPYLNVRVADDIRDVKAYIERLGLKWLHTYAFDLHQCFVGIPGGADPFEFAHELELKEEILFAEPEFTEYIPCRQITRGELFASMDSWQWDTIQAPEAWKLSSGQGTKIGIIDSGFNISHSDLKDGLSVDSGFFESRIFSAARFHRADRGAFPDHKHGTFCAGIACARANDHDALGIAFEAQFMAIAALQGDLLGSQSTLARAVAYAAFPGHEDASFSSKPGCDVISCSLGPDAADWAMSSTLRNAIDFAVSRGRNGLGTPVFWAVPNDEEPISSIKSSDEVSAYENTISVGASTREERHGETAFGPELDFLAPGINVLSLAEQTGTKRAGGTSYATPCAAGVAALMLAVNPALPWTEIRAILRDTCDKIGGVAYDSNGRHARYGSGRINALNAVQGALKRK